MFRITNLEMFSEFGKLLWIQKLSKTLNNKQTTTNVPTFLKNYFFCFENDEEKTTDKTIVFVFSRTKQSFLDKKIKIKRKTIVFSIVFINNTWLGLIFELIFRDFNEVYSRNCFFSAVLSSTLNK